MTERWVLAYDATCGQCRAISATVERETAGRIEVLPLNHADVDEWRAAALGADAPWAPTLIRVREDGRPGAWTGPALGIRLVRRLGLRATVRLLNALSDLRHQAERLPDDERTLDRGRFLKLGAGLGMAAGIVLTGRTPAIAGQVPDEVDTWMKANAGSLPQTYQDLVKVPVPYRKAVYRTLPQDRQAQLWLDHLAEYRRTHPKLTPAQSDLITRLRAFVATKSASRNKALEGEVLEVFGLDEGRALVATLGPADVTPMLGCKCDCSTESDYCWTSGCRYAACRCRYYEQGCGFLYSYSCNGYCSDCESCQPCTVNCGPSESGQAS